MSWDEVQQNIARVSRERRTYERLTAMLEALPYHSHEDFMQLVKDLTRVSESQGHVARRWLSTYDR
jgi:hypothetical protein